jgi:hypothetical protein
LATFPGYFVALALGAFGLVVLTPDASAHCEVNTGTCEDGHCPVNTGTCDNAETCVVNLADCGNFEVGAPNQVCFQ